MTQNVPRLLLSRSLLKDFSHGQVRSTEIKLTVEEGSTEIVG